MSSALLDEPSSTIPRIAALFLIRFDVKAGYTIAWKRAVSDDVELDDVVEYKSLPSGLHNIKEDLIYFVQGKYVGHCAFINLPTQDETERNALMLAVGILVPLSGAGQGRAWHHTAKLQELVSKIGDDESNTNLLLDFWEANKLSHGETVQTPSSADDDPHVIETPVSRTRSDASLLRSSRQLEPFHPALSLPQFFNTFGPLIFPLYRAALLRKRVLFFSDAPVQLSCHYVYDLALLASLPRSIVSNLPSSASLHRHARPFFSIGANDLPFLTGLSSQSTSPSSSYIACTTDRVLGLKPELYNLSVKLPSHDASGKLPTLTRPPPRGSPRGSKPSQVRATQRDYRRFCHLRACLPELQELEQSRRDTAAASRTTANGAANVDQHTGRWDDYQTASSHLSFLPCVEPPSLSLLAYFSLASWWTTTTRRTTARMRSNSASSAQDVSPFDEMELDTSLLIQSPRASYLSAANPSSTSSPASSSSPSPSSPSSPPSRIPTTDTANQAETIQQKKQLEVSLVTYFRNMTVQIFTVLSSVIQHHDNAASDPDVDLLDTQARYSLSDDNCYNYADDVNPRNQRRERYTDDDNDNDNDDDDDNYSDNDNDRQPLIRPPSSSSRTTTTNTTSPHSSASSSSSSSSSSSREPIILTYDDMARMGLDTWSSADRSFVEELVAVWWQRRAFVLSEGVTICGVRIY